MSIYNDRTSETPNQFSITEVLTFTTMIWAKDKKDALSIYLDAREYQNAEEISDECVEQALETPEELKIVEEPYDIVSQYPFMDEHTTEEFDWNDMEERTWGYAGDKLP